MADRRGHRRRPAVLVLAVAGALLAAACGGGSSGSGSGGSGSGGSGSGGSGASGDPAVGTLVMVIRHGEKPEGGTSGPGVDAQGKPDDSSLTAVGWERANALVNLFDPASGSPRAGLGVPKAIYAAGANDDGEGLRPRETVTPLTAKLGLQMNTTYGAGDEKKLVEQATAEPGPTLISWQHGGIPDIAKAFDSVTPKPPSDWPDDRFDVVWTFTRTADGWQFAQVPEMVLPQDTDTVIED